ncbi:MULTISPECIES: hypothetical protein [unclassified Natrinema]|nr:MULTISPECIES: hypothetical protein [unclassified Natrinema]AFO57244.1 hypothetical protein NJ7G_2003 [Natrinema sp. J7-2]
MRAVTRHGETDVRVDDGPEPGIVTPTEAAIESTATRKSVVYADE